ncbi:MAG: hypothetical protein GYA87_05010 [Christensenellaceae bacterium]|nr:hypothetical protein [Christensenellaceae bacterium]
MIKKTIYNLKSNKIKKNYSFAVVSDYHNAKYDSILPLITDVDCILMPGDFVVRYQKGKHTRVKSFLNEAVKIAPVFCSMGNHDFRTIGRKAFINLVSSAGATPLIDEFVVWNDIILAGWYYNKNEGILDRLDKSDAYKILLSHKPEWYPKYIKDKNFDLIISGHAHGGQIRIFNRGIFSPGQGLFPKYTHGIYYDKLIVSTGVSNPVHMPRWGNPKEVIIINLNKS